MSDASIAKAKNIQVRRVQLHSESQLPSDYGTTPGGTLFGTTPGGTRIIYDRTFLLECRNSPLAKSPIANLPHIPGVTCPLEKGESPKSPLAKQSPSSRLQDQKSPASGAPVSPVKKTAGSSGAGGDDPQFEMDI